MRYLILLLVLLFPLFLKAQKIHFDKKTGKYLYQPEQLKKKQALPCDTIFFIRGAHKLVQYRGLWGILWPSGYWKISPQYDEIQFAPKVILLRKGDKWGLYSDQLMHPPVMMGQYGKQELYHQLHNPPKLQYQTLDCVYDSIQSFSYQTAHLERWLVANIFTLYSDGRIGLYNSKSELVKEPIYDEIAKRNDGSFEVRIGDRYGRLNQHGEQLIPVEYHEIIDLYGVDRPVQVTSAPVSINYYAETVNQAPFQFTEPFYFTSYNIRTDSLADKHWFLRHVVRQKHKWGLIHVNGEILIEAMYDEIMPLGNKGFHVRKGTDWIHVDKMGND